MDWPLKKSLFFGPLKKFQFFPFNIILFFPQYRKPSFLIRVLWNTPQRKSSIFGQNPWTNLFANGLTPLALLKTLIFSSSNHWFFFYNIEKRTFLISFVWKAPIRKSSIFGQNPRTNPFWKMSTFWPLLKLQFFGLKMIVFYLKYPKTTFSGIISVKKKR